jgi:hypothetical protein
MSGIVPSHAAPLQLQDFSPHYYAAISGWWRHVRDLEADIKRELQLLETASLERSLLPGERERLVE